MSKDGHANRVTKHRLRESLARHPKSEMKCLGQKNLSPCSSCMITVSTTANFYKPTGINAYGRTYIHLPVQNSFKGRTANLRLLNAQQRQRAPQGLGSAPEKLVQCKGWRKHHMSTRRGREEAPTPAVIKTLEKPLRCCPFHRAPDLSPTFCRRQTALKIRPL